MKAFLVVGFAGAMLAACSAVPAQPGRGFHTVSGDYLAAHLAATEGNLHAAASYYDDALRDDPTNADLLTRAFLYSATIGEMPRAISLAKRITAQDPANRAAELVLAIDAFSRADYAAIIDDLHKSGQGPFNSITDDVLVAWAFEGQGNTDAALKTLDDLQSQSGAEGLYAFDKALLLDHANRTKDAEDAYKEAVSVMGTSARVADAYGRFLEIHGKNAEAAGLYVRLKKNNPGNPVAVTAEARMAAGQKPSRLLETPAQGAAEGLFSIASSLNEPRSADVAMIYLNLALYLRPDFDLAHVLLADHYENQGKYETAIEVYDRFPPDSPYYTIVKVQSVIDLSRLGHNDEAIAKIEAMSEKLPEDVDVLTALGDLLRASEKYAEAVTAYDKAIAASGKAGGPPWGLYFARGISEDHSKNWDAAERDFKQALKMTPDQPEVLNYLGYSWVVQGRNLKEAVGMLEKARSLRPADGYIVDSVGWAYFHLGRYQDAASTLEEAVLLSPADPTINDHLGDAYWKVGRKIDARFQWQHALNLDPNADQKPLIQRKLDVGLDAVAGGAS